MFPHYRNTLLQRSPTNQTTLIWRSNNTAIMLYESNMASTLILFNRLSCVLYTLQGIAKVTSAVFRILMADLVVRGAYQVQSRMG